MMKDKNISLVSQLILGIISVDRSFITKLERTNDIK